MLIGPAATQQNGVLNNLTAGDDSSLVTASQQGDKAAFELLVRRHEHAILRRAMRITGNRDDAEDVVQQTFQKAFVHLPEFEGRSSFSTWLTRIALNEALMMKRSVWRSRTVSVDESDATAETTWAAQIADPKPSPEKNYSRQERSRILHSALGDLKPQIRAVLQIYYLDEQPAKETAQRLGVSVPAVKARLNRGRKMLRERLKRCVMPSTRTYSN